MTEAKPRRSWLRLAAAVLLLLSIVAFFLPWLRLTVTLPVSGMGGMTVEQLLETVAGKSMAEVRAGLRETLEDNAEALRAAVNRRADGSCRTRTGRRRNRSGSRCSRGCGRDRKSVV